MRARVSPRASVSRTALSPTARNTHEIILISKSLPVVCDRRPGMNESRSAKRKHPRTVPANAGKDHIAGALRRNHRTAFCKYQQAPAVTPSVMLLRRTGARSVENFLGNRAEFRKLHQRRSYRDPGCGRGGSAGGRGGLGYGGGFGRVLM